MPGKRIAVVGTTGSGKTTTAKRLSAILDLPHVELDALYWHPDWTETPVEPFRAVVSEVLATISWVVDGNYGKVRDIVLARADTVIWLDLPISIVLKRLSGRTARRIITKQELWSGNRERLGNLLRPKDNILLWALRTYGRRRREYEFLFASGEYDHIRKVRLSSSRQIEEWFASLEDERS